MKQTKKSVSRPQMRHWVNLTISLTIMCKRSP